MFKIIINLIQDVLFMAVVFKICIITTYYSQIKYFATHNKKKGGIIKNKP